MTFVLVNYTTQSPRIQAYQEISGGQVGRYTDVKGNTIASPSGESDVVQPQPGPPLWALPNMTYVLIEYWTNTGIAQAYADIVEVPVVSLTPPAVIPGLPPAPPPPPPQQQIQSFTDLNGNPIDIIPTTLIPAAVQPALPAWASAKPIATPITPFSVSS